MDGPKLAAMLPLGARNDDFRRHDNIASDEPQLMLWRRSKRNLFPRSFAAPASVLICALARWFPCASAAGHCVVISTVQNHFSGAIKSIRVPFDQ
jgi:hypothetical protein